MTVTALSRLGIAPYAPPRGRTHLAAAAPQPARRPEAATRQHPPQRMARVNLQPPLALQPGVPSPHLAQGAKRFWLSSTYPPGSAKLVDVVAAGDVMMGSIGTWPQSRTSAAAPMRPG